MHLIVQMYNIYNIYKHTLTLGDQIWPKKSYVKQRSGTNNMEGGERCAFCSCKCSHYFELSKKNTHTSRAGTTRPGGIDGNMGPGPRAGSGQCWARAENLNSTYTLRGARNAG